jgi:uncharacterized protein YbaA (DUF1428 family)
MPYVDGFLLPVPTRNLPAYRKLARRAGKIWREHGALEYRECVGDDLKVKGVAAFPRAAGARSGETVVLSWIVYRSKAHRDRVNARVMKDPRIAAMGTDAMPFDVKRMAYGGFRIFVEA